MGHGIEHLLPQAVQTLMDLVKKEKHLDAAVLRRTPEINNTCISVCVYIYMCVCASLKTLTSLKKEEGPFFLGDNSIWSFPLFLPLAITAFGGPEGYSSLAIIAFRAFGSIILKYYCRLGKMEVRSLDSDLI